MNWRLCSTGNLDVGCEKAVVFKLDLLVTCWYDSFYIDLSILIAAVSRIMKQSSIYN